MAAELAFASSGMTTPFPSAIFLAYNICAGLTGLEFELPGRFTLGFLGRVFVEKFSADRYRRLVAGWRLDALVPGETVGKALHRRRRRKRPGAVADRNAKQGRPAGGGAFLELANDALGDIAHCVNRTDHLLLADNHIVEQAFKLRRHPRIDQGRVGGTRRNCCRRCTTARLRNCTIRKSKTRRPGRRRVTTKAL